MQTQDHIIRRQIADCLHDIADPEIPVVSIVDLGMVIDIRPENSHWRVDLAPTYSGCPAIDVIPFLVKAKLEESGYSNVHIEMEVSPPWSTDWISVAGLKKLEDYGIAPPHGQASTQMDEGTPRCCPQCGSSDTALISRHGSTPCKAAYRCLACLEPFEYFKCF